jgi:hypothetical protein
MINDVYCMYYSLLACICAIPCTIDEVNIWPLTCNTCFDSSCCNMNWYLS